MFYENCLIRKAISSKIAFRYNSSESSNLRSQWYETNTRSMNVWKYHRSVSLVSLQALILKERSPDWTEANERLPLPEEKRRIQKIWWYNTLRLWEQTAVIYLLICKKGNIASFPFRQHAAWVFRETVPESIITFILLLFFSSSTLTCKLVLTFKWKQLLIGVFFFYINLHVLYFSGEHIFTS